MNTNTVLITRQLVNYIFDTLTDNNTISVGILWKQKLDDVNIYEGRSKCLKIEKNHKNDNFELFYFST